MTTDSSQNTDIDLTVSNQLAIYKAIYSSASDAIVFTDPQRRVILINKAMSKMLGYSLNEVQGKSAELFYAHSSDFHEQGKQRYSQNSENKTGVYEINYKNKNGSLIVGETHGNHVHDENGNLLGYIGVIRDISERKKANSLINRFGRIVEDSLNEVYLFGNESLTFIDVNRGARQNLGYSIDELRTMKPFEIKPEYTEDTFKILIFPLRNQTSQKLIFETSHRRKNGTTYPVEVHLQRVNLEGDYFFLAIILDITKRKRAEAELQQHREKLKQLVAERTAELQSQTQELELANDELRRFNYSVSHDLKAPLRAIHGFSNVVLQDYKKLNDDIIKDYLNRICNATVRMEQIIEDMLKLSRVRIENISLEPIDITQLVTIVVSLLQERNNHSNVSIQITPTEIALGDPGLIRIVLENLWDNAWKYCSTNENIEIEFGMLKQNEENVYFIKDNGVGFDMKFYDKLFNPFQRLHNESEFSGSGIGLATVQTILHRHGCKIWANSVKHSGTTFYFTLPKL